MDPETASPEFALVDSTALRLRLLEIAVRDTSILANADLLKGRVDMFEKIVCPPQDVLAPEEPVPADSKTKKK